MRRTTLAPLFALALSCGQKATSEKISPGNASLLLRPGSAGTLSVLEDAPGGCNWRRVDPGQAPALVHLFEIPAGSGALKPCENVPSLAWNEQASRALVLLTGPNAEVGQRLWEANLEDGSMRQISLPSLHGQYDFFDRVWYEGDQPGVSALVGTDGLSERARRLAGFKIDQYRRSGWSLNGLRWNRVPSRGFEHPTHPGLEYSGGKLLRGGYALEFDSLTGRSVLYGTNGGIAFEIVGGMVTFWPAPAATP